MGLGVSMVMNKQGTIIHAHSDGRLGFDCQPIKYLNELGSEEINIDWMRTNKPETIELNGKTWIKADIEKMCLSVEDICKIKPVD